MKYANLFLVAVAILLLAGCAGLSEFQRDVNRCALLAGEVNAGTPDESPVKPQAEELEKLTVKVKDNTTGSSSSIWLILGSILGGAYGLRSVLKGFGIYLPPGAIKQALAFVLPKNGKYHCNSSKKAR